MVETKMARPVIIARSVCIGLSIGVYYTREREREREGEREHLEG